MLVKGGTTLLLPQPPNHLFIKINLLHNVHKNVELKLIGLQHNILSLKLLTDHELIGKSDI